MPIESTALNSVSYEKVFFLCMMIGVCWAIFTSVFSGGWDADHGGAGHDGGSGHAGDAGGHDSGFDTTVDPGVQFGTDAGIHGCHAADAPGVSSHAGATGHSASAAAGHSAGPAHGGHARQSTADGTSDNEVPGVTPFSPLFLSILLASFGALGLLFIRGFALPASLAAMAAGIIGIVIAWGVSRTFIAVFVSSQTNSLAESFKTVGTEAEVTIPIPQGGTGEVAYVLAGKRLTAPASSEDGMPIEQGRRVVITGMRGTTFLVEPFDI